MQLTTLHKHGYVFILEASLKFVTNPVDTTTSQGLKAKFSVTTTPIANSYKWFFQDGPISAENADYKGALTDTLVITKCLPKHKGAYKCVATILSKRFISASATLIIGKFAF